MAGGSVGADASRRGGRGRREDGDVVVTGVGDVDGAGGGVDRDSPGVGEFTGAEGLGEGADSYWRRSSGGRAAAEDVELTAGGFDGERFGRVLGSAQDEKSLSMRKVSPGREDGVLGQQLAVTQPVDIVGAIEGDSTFPGALLDVLLQTQCEK